MSEQRVTHFAGLHQALGGLCRDAGWVWRGHAYTAWPLLPAGGRAVAAGRAKPGHDEVFFRRWLAEARKYLNKETEDEWMMFPVGGRDRGRSDMTPP